MFRSSRIKGYRQTLGMTGALLESQPVSAMKTHFSGQRGGEGEGIRHIKTRWSKA